MDITRLVVPGFARARAKAEAIGRIDKVLLALELVPENLFR
jgi:hypothetical protein